MNGSSRNICVVFNPTARGEKAVGFQAQLHALERQAAFRPTQGPGDARKLARQAVEEGFTTLVAAGGDGTVNEVLNGLLDAPEGAIRARLAVLPLGTVNVFAKEIGIPTHFPDAWRIIEHGSELQVDLPYAEYSHDGHPHRRYFVQLAGAGLDSCALALVDWELKKRIGPLAYLWAGLKALNAPRPQVTLTTEGQSLTAPVIIIGNGRFYGGRFAVLPHASMTDGQLDVAIGPRVSWPIILRGCWYLFRDRFHQCRDVIHLQSPAFTLTSLRPLPFQLEGDNVGSLPATFGLIPLGLRVVVPPNNLQR